MQDFSRPANTLQQDILSMLKLCATILIGSFGGYAALRCGLPLPWLTGSIGSVACYQLVTGAANTPKRLRQFGQLLLGAAIGLYFSPAAAAEAGTFFGLIIAVALFSIAAAWCMSLMLQGLTNLDRATAYFASMPGGVSEMAILAERFGGNPSLVTMFQSIRLVSVVFIIPASVFLFEDVTAIFEYEAIGEFHFPETIALILSAVAASILVSKIGIPNGWFIGPLISGIAVSLYDHGAVSIPDELVEMGQVLIGAALGSRFQKGAILELGRLFPVSIVLTITLIALNITLAAIASVIVPIPLSNMILGTAPGGIAEMGITAKAAGVDVAIVTAFHLMRIFFVLILSAPAYRFTGRFGQT